MANKNRRTSRTRTPEISRPSCQINKNVRNRRHEITLGKAPGKTVHRRRQGTKIVRGIVVQNCVFVHNLLFFDGNCPEGGSEHAKT